MCDQADNLRQLVQAAPTVARAALREQHRFSRPIADSMARQAMMQRRRPNIGVRNRADGRVLPLVVRPTTGVAIGSGHGCPEENWSERKEIRHESRSFSDWSDSSAQADWSGCPILNWDGVPCTARGKGQASVPCTGIAVSWHAGPGGIGIVFRRSRTGPLVCPRHMDVGPLAQPTRRSGCQPRWMWM